VAAIFLFNDDDGDGSNGPPQYTAEALLPELGDVGLRLTEKQPDAAAQAVGQDTWRALYAGSTQLSSVQIYATVLHDVGTAERQFTQLATALRNPPPEFVGSGVPQLDATPTSVGQNAKAYVTSRPDGRNQHVWTDIYRFDRAVVIVQVLGRETDAIVPAARHFADLPEE
jgi:hypothetical protein